MDQRTLWDLNLDAEFELAARGGYSRSRAALALVAEHTRGARGQLAPGDLVLGDPGTAGEDLRGCLGRAWCPTPSALARLRDAGAEPAPAPALEILREVNGRAFCAELGQTLPHAFHTHLRDDLCARLDGGAGPSLWLAKRAFGVAGRGQRKLRAGALSEPDLRWIEASLDGASLQVEPWLEIEAEFVLQALLEPGAELRLGPVMVQLTGPGGAWLETLEPAEAAVDPEDAAAIKREGRRVAEALSKRGYFGPFGLDAYRYRCPETGESRLQPRSEINARYTMGWKL
ncbi:MAG: hypothetical protein ABGY71_03905 [bacterium]|nr:hypothetical protein [Planctomycetota bacterium]HIL51746.1 hypothetical protein [Planctomycetota bacterium]